MPTSLLEILKLLGFATPFLYAAATYGLFHYLDKRASGPAKKAISDWLENTAFDKQAIASSFVELFDRLYSKPLSAGRAMARSASLSVAITSAFIIMTNQVPLMWYIAKNNQIAFAGLLLFNTMSDYISLFVIRYFLSRGQNRPVVLMLIGSLLGTSFVLAIYFIVITWGALWYSVVHLEPLGGLIERVLSAPGLLVTGLTSKVELMRIIFLAGLTVHIWLPLLALSIVAAQLLNISFHAATRMQWFLKQGTQHPLDAVGYVAAAIIFVSTALIQTITR